ncbi:hypothetical protein BC835DRAFT_1414663 [Cytidiella melzeri]|nr:hypothetical protein BC835DRAFT_1414663 [Cytidiella melzeri]
MVAGKLIVPQPGKETPLDKLCVVMVDDINSSYDGTYTYFEWICLRVPNGDSAFPMAFFCPNRFDISAICKIAEFLRTIIGLQPREQIAAIDRLCELESCKHILTKEWTHWGVRNGLGGVEFISGKCSIGRTHTPSLVHSTVHGTSRAQRWPKLLSGCFCEVAPSRSSSFTTLTWLTSSLALQHPHLAIGSFHPEASSQSLQQQLYAIRRCDPHSFWYYSVLLELNASGYYNRTPTPAEDTPSRSSRRDTTDGASKNSSSKNKDPSGSRTTRSARASNDDGERSRSHVKTECLGAFDNMPSFHERNLKGHIRATLFTTPAPTTIRVPSLGNYLDNFVDAYGFPNAFIIGVFTGWLNSSNLDEFMLAISHIATMEEARFMWRWIAVPVDHATRFRFTPHHE